MSCINSAAGFMSWIIHEIIISWTHKDSFDFRFFGRYLLEHELMKWKPIRRSQVGHLKKYWNFKRNLGKLRKGYEIHEFFWFIRRYFLRSEGSRSSTDAKSKWKIKRSSRWSKSNCQTNSKCFHCPNCKFWVNYSPIHTTRDPFGSFSVEKFESIRLYQKIGNYGRPCSSLIF